MKKSYLGVFLVAIKITFVYLEGYFSIFVCQHIINDRCRRSQRISYSTRRSKLRRIRLLEIIIIKAMLKIESIFKGMLNLKRLAFRLSIQFSYLFKTKYLSVSFFISFSKCLERKHIILKTCSLLSSGRK